MKPLDRHLALPLWAQLAADLRARVAAGDFAEGFPTEQELSASYEVSRNTVREAMRRLQGDGLVDRQRGRGTVLAQADIEQSLAGFYSLARTITEQGLEERSEILTVDVRTAGDIGENLALDAASEVVFIERLRFAGSEPLALDRSWLPATRTRPLLDIELTSGSLYAALDEHCGLRVDGGFERITPQVPTPADRAVLRLPRGQAAFSVEREVRSGGLLVEWRWSLVRGDRFRFVSRWL